MLYVFRVITDIKNLDFEKKITELERITGTKNVEIRQVNARSADVQKELDDKLAQIEKTQ